MLTHNDESFRVDAEGITKERQFNYFLTIIEPRIKSTPCDGDVNGKFGNVLSHVADWLPLNCNSITRTTLVPFAELQEAAWKMRALIDAFSSQVARQETKLGHLGAQTCHSPSDS